MIARVQSTEVAAAPSTGLDNISLLRRFHDCPSPWRRNGRQGDEASVSEQRARTGAQADEFRLAGAAGDVPDPRGGIRWMIPERAVYWEELP